MTDVKVTLTIKFSEEKEAITLTEEDARTLYNKLHNIFGNKMTPLFPNHPHTYTYPIYNGEWYADDQNILYGTGEGSK